MKPLQLLGLDDLGPTGYFGPESGIKDDESGVAASQLGRRVGKADARPVEVSVVEGGPLGLV